MSKVDRGREASFEVSDPNRNRRNVDPTPAD